MSQQLSISTMIKRIGGLQGTKDLTEWEDEFVSNVVDRTRNGEQTTSLTSRQAEIIERIHDKHFA